MLKLKALGWTIFSISVIAVFLVAIRIGEVVLGAIALYFLVRWILDLID